MNQKTQSRVILCLGLLLLSHARCPSASAATSPDESGGLTSNELLRKAYEQICAGKAEDAVPTLCQVVRTDRNSPTARRYLAFVLLQQGQGKEALAQLEALQALQPEGYTFDVMMRGVANDMVGEHKKLFELFQQAMAREPQSDYYRVKTIDSLIGLLRYDEAEKLANEGADATKEPKIAAIYKQKVKKIRSILRLTGRTRTGRSPQINKAKKPRQEGK